MGKCARRYLRQEEDSMAKSTKAKDSSSKRSKKKAQASEAARQTKKQIAYSRRESKQNRIIYLLLGAVAAVILVVLAIGLIQELVIKPSTPVARVNGTRIAKDDYEDLLRLRRYTSHMNILSLQEQLSNIDTSDEANQFLISLYEQQMAQLQSSLGLLPETTLDTLIEDALVQEKADEAGISVSDAEVVESINEDLRSIAAPPPQTPITGTQELATPTAVPQEDLDEILQNALGNMGLSETAYQAIVQRGMLRDEVQDLLASEVISTGLVVHVQLIQTETEEEATTALERIESGEDFSVVATEVSTDTLTVEDGGDVGWVTTGQLSSRYGQELESEVFASEVGEPTIVESGGQHYLFLVVERDENGPLPAEVLSQRQASALSDWLEEQKASPDVEIERLLQPDQIPPDPFDSLSGGLGP